MLINWQIIDDLQGGRMAAKKRVTRQLTAQHLLLVITSVPGSTAACVTHGDEGTVGVLLDYYALVAAVVTPQGGQVIKAMGDAVLVTFPRDGVREAIEALRLLQAKATALWRAFDERCCVHVKIGAGKVVCGRFGVPGNESLDVYGDALNQLFRRPSGEFVLTPEVEALLV